MKTYLDKAIKVAAQSIKYSDLYCLSLKVKVFLYYFEISSNRLFILNSNNSEGFFFDLLLNDQLHTMLV